MIDNLVERIRKKDEKAFEEVYNLYNKIVAYVIFKIVEDNEVTKDIVQDTFLTMYNKIDQYSGKGNFKYWLLQIAKNKAKNYFKKMTKEKELLLENIEQIENEKYASIDIEGFIKKIEEILDPTSAEIVITKIVFDYTFDAISKKLNLSLSDVYRKYKKAINIIKDHIEI